MIDQLPEWFQIFTLSMIPGVESRFIIPIAVARYGWNWWEAFPIAIAGNMFLVPFGLLFLHKIEHILSHFESCRKAMNKIFPKIRQKADKKIQRYEYLALVFFVAVPLPFTGAGLGVLIAYFHCNFFDTNPVSIPDFTGLVGRRIKGYFDFYPTFRAEDFDSLIRNNLGSTGKN